MEQSKSKIIDNLDDVEKRENITLEDLDIQYHTGRAIVSGTEAFVRRTGLPTERRSNTSVHQAALEICTAQLWKSSKWLHFEQFVDEVIEVD